MSKITAGLAVASALLFAHAASADEVRESPEFHKPGFISYLDDGRLWVFANDSKELADFRANPEPAVFTTRIGKGPQGMTIRSITPEMIDAYLAAPK